MFLSPCCVVTLSFTFEQWPKSGTPDRPIAVIGYPLNIQSHNDSGRHLIGRNHTASERSRMSIGCTRLWLNKSSKCTRLAYKPFDYLLCVVVITYLCNIFSFLFIPLIILAPLSRSLPVVSNSDPGSHSGPSASLPTSARAFIFISRRSQHFLPSSTRVELYPPTLLGALSS